MSISGWTPSGRKPLCGLSCSVHAVIPNCSFSHCSCCKASSGLSHSPVAEMTFLYICLCQCACIIWKITETSESQQKILIHSLGTEKVPVRVHRSASTSSSGEGADVIVPSPTCAVVDPPEGPEEGCASNPLTVQLWNELCNLSVPWLSLCYCCYSWLLLLRTSLIIIYSMYYIFC